MASLMSPHEPGSEKATRHHPTPSPSASRTCREDERQGLINEIFSAVAAKYDLMNDLMSGGLHRLWKDDLIAWMGPPKSAQAFQLLDVAGGTGDIAERFLNAGGSGCKAVLFDINPEMVAEGRKRLASARRPRQLHDRQCRGAAVSRQELRRLHGGFRHPQRHPHRHGAQRGLSRAQARRPLPVPGVFQLRSAAARPGV